MTHQDLFDTRPKTTSPRKSHFPEWLHRKLPAGNALWQTHEAISSNRLHTVCEEAKCPNLVECYSKKTATFLLMGKSCTRSCGFCEIDFSKQPAPLDPDEPERVAASVLSLGLRHVVLTMVARDDLADGGAHHLVEVIRAIRKTDPSVTIETLTSDFSAHFSSLDLLAREAPEIFNHNIETVRRLTPQVRHKATYERSLSVLTYVKANYPQLLVKSGIMLGLGETEEEVQQALADLKGAGCDIVTIGQYLRPSKKKLQVREFIHPDLFASYEAYGKAIGISHMYAGPFVRSSYNAHLFIQKNNQTISITSH